MRFSCDTKPGLGLYARSYFNNLKTPRLEFLNEAAAPSISSVPISSIHFNDSMGFARSMPCYKTRTLFAVRRHLRKRWTALDDKKQQAAALTIFGDSLQTLVDCCDDALKGLDAISNFWSTMGSKLATLKNELTNASKDKAMVVRDVHLTSGQEAWRQLVDYATLLQRTADDIEVQNREIAIAA